MPCFICAKCECIENTACGHYWGAHRDCFAPGSLSPDLIGKPLCSECTPLLYNDGGKAGTGEWHGRFDKNHWSTAFSEKPEGTF